MDKHTFGGRIRPKQEQDKVDWSNLVDLQNKGMAFIYQRLSTHEQLKRSVYSIKAQDALEDMAKEDGYSEEQIHVERRDLGISGTKGQDERAGLAYLISCIEQSMVESVYVVHISRLFRDQTLIDAFAFGELCKKQNVIIVTPQMRLNLIDRMHMRLYRMEVERAADELELMRSRLGGALRLKARQGYYTGGSIAPGYVLNTDKHICVEGKQIDNPGYHKYEIYEPHARIVRRIFELAMLPGTTVPKIIRQCRLEGVALPPLPEELAKVKGNRVSFARTEKDPEGNSILTISRVRSILRNPVYIGWWVWDGEVMCTDNHPAIIDERTFFAAQDLFEDRPHRPRSGYPQRPLSGILYCGNHDVPRRLIYSNSKPGEKYRHPIYQCRDISDNSAHATIRADYLDIPIGEAVISQCAYPELAADVIKRLEDEYREARTRTTSYSKELRRVKQEIDNLESNYYTGILSPERAAKIEQLIDERLKRLSELSDLQNTEIARLVGTSITQEDIELVKEFLANLSEGWESQPPEIKNAFFRLVLEQITVWPSPSDIRVCITWRTGLEQCLIVHRPYHAPPRKWTEEETIILEAHYLDMPSDQLQELLPDKTWRQIRAKGTDLGLPRVVNDRKRGGGRLYQPWEDEVVRRHYRGEINMQEALAELKDRTEDSLRTRLKQMGLQRDFRKKPEWEWIEPTLDTNGHLSVQAI